MTLRFKSKRILIPDVPPPTRGANGGAVIAGISVICGTAVIVAVIFAFSGS